MKKLSDRAFSASIITLVGSVFFTLASMIVQSLVGRIGGATALGKYAAALLSIEFLAMIILVGTPTAITKKAASLINKADLEEARTLLSSQFLLLGITALIAGLFSVLLFEFLQQLGLIKAAVQRAELPWIFIGGAALSLSKSAASFYYGDFNNLKAVVINVVGAVVTAVLVFLSLQFGLGLSLLHALATGFVVGAALAIFMLTRDRHLALKPEAGFVRELVSFSLPLFGVSVVAFGSTWLDRIVVGAASGLAGVGVLTSAVVIVRAIRFFPQVLTPVFISTYSRFRTGAAQIQQISEVFSLDLFLISLFCLGAASMTYVAAEPIKVIVWGRDFDALATTILRVELLGVVGLPYSLQTPNFLVVMDRPELNFRLAIIHVSLQFVLSVFLLQLWGVIGVALATSLTLSIMALIRHWVITHVLSVDLKTQPIGLLLLAFGLSVGMVHFLEGLSTLSDSGALILGLLVVASLFLSVFLTHGKAVALIKSTGRNLITDLIPVSQK